MRLVIDFNIVSKLLLQSFFLFNVFHYSPLGVIVSNITGRLHDHFRPYFVQKRCQMLSSLFEKSCNELHEFSQKRWVLGNWRTIVRGQFLKLSVVRGIRGQFWNLADNFLKNNEISKFDGQFQNLADNCRLRI